MRPDSSTQFIGHLTSKVDKMKRLGTTNRYNIEVKKFQMIRLSYGSLIKMKRVHSENSQKLLIQREIILSNRKQWPPPRNKRM